MNSNNVKYSASFVAALMISFLPVSAKELTDTTFRDQSWDFHYQNTVITQYHPSFRSEYSGKNSLTATSETHTSITGTMFFGIKLTENTRVYFNPELAGGAGFSSTTGIAGFPNGEVYRVSDPSPHIYIARLYFEHLFPLSNEKRKEEDDFNQLARMKPASYISISAGKFSVMDFFDINKYSHDPRTQFFNWSLMGNGAWDYPANTRGYTFGLTIELVKPEWAIRSSLVMVPVRANGSIMDGNIKKAKSEALEFERQYNISNHKGTIRIMSYFTQARMGNFNEAIEFGKRNNIPPAIDTVNRIGRIKFGFGLNVEQEISEYAGTFLRAGWNDGNNETWTFTEIDRQVSAGLVINGKLWNRHEDDLGIALIINCLSTDHKNYLKAGGYGFIIGDGNLNYSNELITELYYSFKLPGSSFWITPDYQLIINPAYNKDRGPVHAIGIRVHCEI